VPQALITVNGTPGSDNDLPINLLVQLDNANIGLELTYLWSVLDQPAGTADALSSTTLQNPTFTPKKEGTYLIELVVNATLPTEQRNQVICAVRQVKTRERIPAAGETVEDGTRGWALANNGYLQRIDHLLADPGVMVGVAGAGTPGTGNIVRMTGTQAIKIGLPGQENLPILDMATATTALDVQQPLCIVIGKVGGGAIAPGDLIQVRYIGRYEGVAIPGAVLGQAVYVSDLALPSLTPGTVVRQIGAVGAAYAGSFDLWFDGVGGADGTLAEPYLIIGPPVGALPNAVRVDAASPTPIPDTVYLKSAVPGRHVLKLQTPDATTRAVHILNGAGQTVGYINGDGTLLLESRAGGGQVVATVQPIDPSGVVLMGSVTNHPLLLVANGLPTWSIDPTTGNLMSFFHYRAIQGVSDPVDGHDAANKGYVDSMASPNLAINGKMDFWQRGVGPVNFGNTPQVFLADRWHAWHSDPAGAGVLTKYPVLGTNFLQVQRGPAEASAAPRYLCQEIDRDLLHRSAQLTQTLQASFVIGKGAGFTGTLHAKLIYGTGATSETLFAGGAAYATGNTVLVDSDVSAGGVFTVTAGVTLPNNATCLGLLFVHTPTGVGGATDNFSVTLVQVQRAGATTGFFAWAGGSYEGELALCQRFFEKSYEVDTDPATVTALGVDALTLNNARFAPRIAFCAPKWRIPTFTFYDNVAGGTGSWRKNAVTLIAVAEFQPTRRNFEVLNTAGAPVVGDDLSGHWVADSEI